MSYRITADPVTEGTAVTDRHFGTNYLANRQGQGEALEGAGAYVDAADLLGVTRFRYPGGTIAESYLDPGDLRHFEEGATDAIEVAHFNDASDTTGLTRLGAFLDFAAARDAEVTVVLPMVRYMEVIRAGTPEQVAAIEAEVKAFVTAALNHRSGGALAAFEIGNEFPSWMGGHNGSLLDSTADAAALMRNIAVWTDQALTAAGAGDVQIIAHTAFVKYGDKGNAPLLRDLFDADLDTGYAHVESVDDFFAAVDAVSSHFYPYEPWDAGATGQQAILEDTGLIADWQAAFDDYAAATGQETRDLGSQATEWNIRNAALLEDGPVGAEQAATGQVALFHTLLSQGVDEMHVWPVLQNNENTLTSHSEAGITAQMTGAAFALLRALTPGLSASAGATGHDSDGDGVEDLFIYTFTQGGRATSFITAAQAMEVTVDYGDLPLVADPTQAHIARLVADDEGLPRIAMADSQALTEGASQLTLNLTPWEMTVISFDAGEAAAPGVAGDLGATLGADLRLAEAADYADLLPDPAAATGTVLRDAGGDSHFQILPGLAVDGGGGADFILGSAGADSVTGGSGDDTLSLHDGDDALQGAAGHDLLVAGAGADWLQGGTGNDTLHGGSGDDLIAGGTGRDMLRGGAGQDVICGGSGDDFLLGEADNDRLMGGGGADRLYGGAGQDELRGSSGDDLLRGGAGNDIMEGGSGNDILLGGAGFDRLEGGAGADILTGAYNADTFLFTDGFGADEITDFDALNAREKIDLSGVSAITSYENLRAAHLEQTADGALIDAGDGNRILLRGVALEDLDPGDFLF